MPSTASTVVPGPPPLTSAAADPARLSLSPTTDSSGFVFPSVYSFPPFFTRQPNPATWSHQVQQWARLVLAWYRFHRQWRIDVSDQACLEPPFHHHALRRHLQLSTLRAIVDHLALSGAAEYDPKPSKSRPPTSAWIYWKRPDEWATVIYDWIKETGQTNSIMTFYELTEGGDLVHTTEFYRMPEPVLRKALEVLIRQGKAQVLKGLGEDGDGVKFV
ncbi:SPOSA6832_03943, partial [Sporobolomyces salmonicolor]